MFKDSHQLGLEWEAANPKRALELNDMLDALPTLAERRVLFATFTKEEQRGLMPEYGRRRENEKFRNGDLVKPAFEKRGISIVSRTENSQTSATHFGLATVIGSKGHGSNIRYLMLHPPWINREGTVLTFVEASSSDLELVTT